MSALARHWLDALRARREARERRLAALEVTRKLPKEARALLAEWRRNPAVKAVCAVLGRTLAIPGERVLECLALAEAEDALVMEQLRAMNDPAAPNDDASDVAPEPEQIDPYRASSVWR